MSHKSLQRNISRLLVLLLCVMLVMTAIPVVFAAEDSCGADLTWRLEAGTLTITGSGAMTDYSESVRAPWYEQRAEITRLELPDGLTHIGAAAFFECKDLTIVNIPDSVTTIGDHAFAYCENLQMLTIGKSVTVIGKSAFSDCYNLVSVDLPDGVTQIGNKGFYRCESITTVTVPRSVTYMGVSVFAYCKNLMSATLKCVIKTLPEYTFYGCNRLVAVVLPDETENISSFSFRGCYQLHTVYHGGSSKTREEIEDIILNELPEINSFGSVSDQQPTDGTVTTGSLDVNADGTITDGRTTVITGQNASVSTEVKDTYQQDGTKKESNTNITVNVTGNDSWSEVTDTVKEEVDKVTEQPDGTETNINVNLYVKDVESIDPGFIESFAGKPVVITVTTQNGSSWKVDASQIGTDKPSGKYDLSYSITVGGQDFNTELGASASFDLRFAKSAQVNSEVLIHLGRAWAYQNATLFQRDRQNYARIQTVVVDQNGYAHFYLAAVDEKTEYCIGINVALPEDAPAPIVPEVLRPEYGNIENYQPIQYEITGRSSSWGMSLGQVMAILAAVMVTVIIVVGGIVFAWNKKRLKSGYVPGWDDDEK